MTKKISLSAALDLIVHHLTVDVSHFARLIIRRLAIFNL